MKGNYAGTKITYFRILSADITGDAFSADDLTIAGNKNFTGKIPITLTISGSNNQTTIQTSNQPYTGDPATITEQAQFKEGKVFSIELLKTHNVYRGLLHFLDNVIVLFLFDQ